MREWLYSRNAVFEALRAGRRQAFQLLVAEGSQEKGKLAQIIQQASLRRIPMERIPRHRLDKISTAHQGVALETSAYAYSDLGRILEGAARRAELPFLLILDTLQDPQNMGTLLRTAEIVGVHGVILPLARTATITPAVVNASSGASEHLLIAQANLAQAIATLKEHNVWVIGLEGGEQAQPPAAIRLDGAIALVVGNEGEGMRQLVRDSCDLLLRLPMRGQVDSLNAAVAGSVALYLAWQARQYQ
ncbi:MAG: 23S rRNA (guanosine(2251)-2'-O)-methyltransferase RlmB [Anaerolineales bacterium]|jgi:23S rRNA (guanosine2251-2'-O)-methyltransferase|nr:23S rRNA (guanosine(2251)-2'-O)-methyltransferase RlmB [Anaerolineales bacterium]